MSYRLIVASAHDTGLKAGSVHCIVTSPPYFGLRSYQGNQAIEWPTVSYAPIAGMPEITIPGCEADCVHEWVDGPTSTQRNRNKRESSTLRANGATGIGEEWTDATHMLNPAHGAYCIHCGGWRGGLGSEPTIEAFIGHLVLVLREMWRVLRDDGCMFFNISDSYSGGKTGNTNGGESSGLKRDGRSEQTRLNGVIALQEKMSTMSFRKPAQVGIRPKNLMGVPQRFFLAAQAEGWIVRSAMPWLKRNQMPDSTTDRPGGVVESIFLMTKNERYFWDAEAVKVPCSDNSHGGPNVKPGSKNLQGDSGRLGKWTDEDKASGRNFRSSDLFFRTWEGMLLDDCGDPMAMVINPKGFSGSHFACFPPELPEMAILAGTSAAGVCRACGAPYRRCVEKDNPRATDEYREKEHSPKDIQSNGLAGRGTKTSGLSKPGWREFDEPKSTTTGWAPSCSCPAHAPIPATVADFFVGSGTTCMVAQWLGRDSIGLDLSDEYHALAHERINTPREKVEDKRAPADGQMGLFEEFAL